MNYARNALWDHSAPSPRHPLFLHVALSQARSKSVVYIAQKPAAPNIDGRITLTDLYEIMVQQSILLVCCGDIFFALQIRTLDHLSVVHIAQKYRWSNIDGRVTLIDIRCEFVAAELASHLLWGYFFAFQIYTKLQVFLCLWEPSRPATASIGVVTKRPNSGYNYFKNRFFWRMKLHKCGWIWTYVSV